MLKEKNILKGSCLWRLFRNFITCKASHNEKEKKERENEGNRRRGKEKEKKQEMKEKDNEKKGSDEG